MSRDRRSLLRRVFPDWGGFGFRFGEEVERLVLAAPGVSFALFIESLPLFLDCRYGRVF